MSYWWENEGPPPYTIGARLLTCIRDNYRGREEEALKFLWSLYDKLEPIQQHIAWPVLNAVEANVKFDLQIARAKRGMSTNG